MGTVLVRHLDDEVVRRLKQRAVRNNRPLEIEVRRILEDAVALKVEDRKRAFLELSKKLLDQQAGYPPQTPSLSIIREDRDSDHGAA